SRRGASSAVTCSTRNPSCEASAATTLGASSFCSTPMTTSSGGLLRNATPRPTASRIGKMNTQNTTSGSRNSSRRRARTSSRYGGRRLMARDSSWRGGVSIVAQPAAGERHEDVLQACVARRQPGQGVPVARQPLEEGRNGDVRLVDVQQD